jgi:glutamine synthetase
MLDVMPAFNLLYRPWVNSFRRMNRRLWNPENASWGEDNHMVGIRVVHGAVPSKLTRFEHRAPGADINPYLTVASLLQGALQGIRRAQDPPDYAQGLATEAHWAMLPHTLPEAIETWRKSPSAAEAFGEAFIEHLACVKQSEWNDFAAAVEAPEKALARGPVTEWEFKRYFTHV